MPQTRSGAATGGKNTIPSLLSADIRIRGDVRSSGEIQIDGVVEGDVAAACLVVSEVGTVSGTIVAQTVRILGTVKGTITAGSIKLARSARVTGDIVHEALAIEEGAFVLGHCRRAEPDQPVAAEGVEVPESSPDPSPVTSPDTSPGASPDSYPVDCKPMAPVAADREDAAIGEEDLTIPAPAR